MKTNDLKKYTSELLTFPSGILIGLGLFIPFQYPSFATVGLLMYMVGVVVGIIAIILAHRGQLT